MVRTSVYKWFHIRVSYEDVAQRDSIVGAIKTLGNQYIVVEETSEKDVDHIHANVLTNYSESKIRRVVIPESLKEKKMSKYVKVCEDIDKMDQYVCKGEYHGFDMSTKQDDMYVGNPLVVLKSEIKYSWAKIEEYHNKYWEIQNSLGVKRESKRQYNFVEEVAQKIKRDRKEVIKSNDSIDRRIVMGFVLDMLRTKAKGFDAVILRRLMNGVLNILDPTGMAAYMETQLFDDHDRMNA